MPPELDIVEMCRLPHAKDSDKLVLAAVERALASIRLHPHCDVDGVSIDRLGGCHQFGNMPPVSAGIMKCTVGALASNWRRLAEEADWTDKIESRFLLEKIRQANFLRQIDKTEDAIRLK
jgi:hypothetical protein